MKKSTIKTITKILAILMIVMCVASISGFVFADAKIDPNSLTPTYAPGNETGLKEKATNIMGWIRNIAVIAAVIVVMVIGVKYILGSVEEKAEYKKTFLPLIVGLFLVVAASTIVTWIMSIA